MGRTQILLKGTRISHHQYYNQYLRWPRIICTERETEALVTLAMVSSRGLGLILF